jgi:hypothetical protein
VADEIPLFSNYHLILPGAAHYEHSTAVSPVLKVTSQGNNTSQSRRHPFACWSHPDFFSIPKRFYPAESKQQFDLTCWTKPISAQPNQQNVRTRICQDDEVAWFRTREDCWIPSFNVQPPGSPDLRETIKYCPTPLHFVGSFREQYDGKSYCYTCTKLDCAARSRAHERKGNLDLSCWKTGDVIDGDE